MSTPDKTPFRHTAREVAVLDRAHGAMMDHLRAGCRYDVSRLAWVDGDGNVVRDDRAWLSERKPITA